jgi:hypothetical protein
VGFLTQAFIFRQLAEDFAHGFQLALQGACHAAQFELTQCGQGLCRHWFSPWVNGRCEDHGCSRGPGAALDVIRGVRNDFAHSFDHELSFQAQSISDRCTNLRTTKALIDTYEAVASKPHRKLSAIAIRAMGSKLFESPRSKFEITVELIAQHLDQIPEDTTDYAGPDFLKEVRQLGERSLNVKVAGTLTIGP